jgi:gamma-glutamyltranspeptidase
MVTSPHSLASAATPSGLFTKGGPAGSDISTAAGAARSARLAWFEGRGLKEIPLRGIVPATLTVPGAVASWTEAHAAYGRVP